MLNLIRQRGRKASTNRVRPGLECLEERAVPTNSAAFMGVDPATQGNWMDHYGGTGYVIQGGSQGILQSLPPQDKVTMSSAAAPYTYAGAPNDMRGLQQPGNASAPRIEAGWFNYTYGTPTTGFDITVKVPGNQIDPVTPLSLYVEDWDGGNRSETIQPFDAQSGAALAPAQTVSNFRDGVYLNWDIKGQVRFHIEKLTGPSTEVSAVFLGGPFTTLPPGGAAGAVSIEADNGNWIDTSTNPYTYIYGKDGYNVYGSALNSVPAYVSTLSTYSQSMGTYTFPMDPLDPRGMQDPANPSTHLSVAKYAQKDFTVDLAFNDTNVHRVSFYVADLDGGNRSEQIDVIDYNKGTVLATQTVSDFAGVGKYVIFDVSGHVQVRFTTLSGPNAVLEGICFDPVPPAALFGGAMASLSSGSGVTTSGPQGSADKAVTLPSQGVMNGVDVVLLDRLFANGRHVHSPDFGTLGLTEVFA